MPHAAAVRQAQAILAGETLATPEEREHENDNSDEALRVGDHTLIERFLADVWPPEDA